MNSSVLHLVDRWTDLCYEPFFSWTPSWGGLIENVGAHYKNRFRHIKSSVRFLCGISHWNGRQKSGNGFLYFSPQLSCLFYFILLQYFLFFFPITRPLPVHSFNFHMFLVQLKSNAYFHPLPWWIHSAIEVSLAGRLINSGEGFFILRHLLPLLVDVLYIVILSCPSLSFWWSFFVFPWPFILSSSLDSNSRRHSIEKWRDVNCIHQS